MHGAICRVAVVFVIACGAAGGAFSQAASKSPLVSQARELADTYYGNGANLTLAADLLARAYAENPHDADLFVQAARVTVKGGHLAFGEFAPGTIDAYRALLDRAIALDPSNAKAHILKAQVFEKQGRYADQLKELDRAKASDTNDPWLWIGYGAHYKKVDSLEEAYEMYSRVERPGPGSSASARSAYVTALGELSQFRMGDVDPVPKLREFAQLALRERYPSDAWTPLGFAETFIDYEQFDDAAHYAREALRTMDFRGGRKVLAAALCGRIAKMNRAGRPMKELGAYIDEARSFGFSKVEISDYLLNRRGIDGNLGWLAVHLQAILP